MSVGSRLRFLLKKLYAVPGLGYLVRLVVAFARLPNAESYHATLLRQLKDRLQVVEAGQVEVKKQAQLVANLAALLEKLRAEQARTAIETQKRVDYTSKTIDYWIAEFHNQRIRDQVNLEAKLKEAGAELQGEIQERRSVHPEVWERTAASADLRETVKDLHNELFGRTGALEAEISKLGVELKKATDYLTNRIEFVRRETLFELRFGATPNPAERPETKARILNPDKLSSVAKGEYRLNVGCGHIPLEDYINVDRRELPSVDVVAEANDLPFEREDLAELFSAHLVEHFPQEQLRREILPYWRTLLKPGGRLRAVVPDAEAMIRGYHEGRISYDDLREVTFGAQDYDGDYHFNMFTSESLCQLLEEAGFVNVNCVEEARLNGRCFELEVVAAKPPGPSKTHEESDPVIAPTAH